MVCMKHITKLFFRNKVNQVSCQSLFCIPSQNPIIPNFKISSPLLQLKQVKSTSPKRLGQGSNIHLPDLWNFRNGSSVRSAGGFHTFTWGGRSVNCPTLTLGGIISAPGPSSSHWVFLCSKYLQSQMFGSLLGSVIFFFLAGESSKHYPYVQQPYMMMVVIICFFKSDVCRGRFTANQQQILSIGWITAFKETFPH